MLCHGCSTIHNVYIVFFPTCTYVLLISLHFKCHEILCGSVEKAWSSWLPCKSMVIQEEALKHLFRGFPYGSINSPSLHTPTGIFALFKGKWNQQYVRDTSAAKFSNTTCVGKIWILIKCVVVSCSLPLPFFQLCTPDHGPVLRVG